MHIDFSIKDWLNENPDGKLVDLIVAIDSAYAVYCGWSVVDAETVRKDNWPDSKHLDIDTSFGVMQTVEDEFDASVGVTWDTLYQTYDRLHQELQQPN